MGGFLLWDWRGFDGDGRGDRRGVERDPVVAMFARANLEAAGDCGDVDVADVQEVIRAGMDGVAAWHVDPDRRPSGGRTTRVELHEPGPNVLRRLLDACPNGAIKLAPAAVMNERWWGESELEWISRGGQCRQLVAWFGALAECARRRRATVVGRGARGDIETFVGEANVECPMAGRVGRFVFEPDAAVLAAKLEGDLARISGLEAVAAGVAYFTSDALVEHRVLVAI